jgi:hypothetical protein
MDGAIGAEFCPALPVLEITPAHPPIAIETPKTKMAKTRRSIILLISHW